MIVFAPMTTGEKLKSQLRELSHNLWWAWNPHIIKLFRDLDPEAFRAANHNPVSVLAGFSPERFEDLARDAALRARVDSALPRAARLPVGAARTWGSVHAGPLRSARSPTFRPSSASTNRCPSIRAAWACSPATT